MSDNKSEVNPASPEGESLNGSFSTNGNDPGAIANATDGAGDLSFLDDLAKAMRTTAAAEQARDAEITDQRRQSHLDAIRAREALEAEELRELAKEDVKGIDAWSDGEIGDQARARAPIASRRGARVPPRGHRLVIASEVEAVDRDLRYRLETERFFDRIGSHGPGRDRTPGRHAASVPRSRPDRPAGGDPGRRLPGARRNRRPRRPPTP